MGVRLRKSSVVLGDPDYDWVRSFIAGQSFASTTERLRRRQANMPSGTWSRVMQRPNTNGYGSGGWLCNCAAGQQM